MPDVRYARVSRRGRWHRVASVVGPTGALRTVCGRILPPFKLTGLEVRRGAPLVADQCEKCR